MEEILAQARDQPDSVEPGLVEDVDSSDDSEPDNVHDVVKDTANEDEDSDSSDDGEEPFAFVAKEEEILQRTAIEFQAKLKELE